MFGAACRLSKPLSNVMFSGRFSLTIICKIQSVSINFEIAAVKTWLVCAVLYSVSGQLSQVFMTTRGCKRQVYRDEDTGTPLFKHTVIGNKKTPNYCRFGLLCVRTREKHLPGSKYQVYKNTFQHVIIKLKKKKPTWIPGSKGFRRYWAARCCWLDEFIKIIMSK